MRRPSSVASAIAPAMSGASIGMCTTQPTSELRRGRHSSRIVARNVSTVMSLAAIRAGSMSAGSVATRVGNGIQSSS
jgi:hypothetical protein